MLLGVGQSTLQNLRQGLPTGTQKQRLPKADKHPLLEVSMSHRPNVKWAGVLMFLWLVYHSEAEYLPTHFRAGCGSNKLSEEAFPDPVDDDQSLRAVESFMKSLHKHYADVEEHMIGPGSFKGARKVLPHGSRTELFWSYRAWAAGREEGAAASFNTFLRVANKVLRLGEKDGVLKFRKQNEHGACDVCTGLKTNIRKTVRQFGVHSTECETAQRAYTRHLLNQWLDRQVYWSMRSLSQAWFKQSIEFGHRALISSVATAAVTVIQDGMDQSKFKVPRTRMAPSKLFQRLFRPTLHVAASWLHGRAIYIYVADEDTKKDGSAQLEMLSRTLNSIADNMPMGLFALREDLSPASFGQCRVEEISGSAPSGKDVLLLAKRWMSDPEPFRVVCLMPAATCGVLRASFAQPGGVEDRRPIAPKVQKNICRLSHECMRQGDISADACAYLTQWCSGELARKPRPCRYPFLEVRRGDVPAAERVIWAGAGRDRHINLKRDDQDRILGTDADDKPKLSEEDDRLLLCSDEEQDVLGGPDAVDEWAHALIDSDLGRMVLQSVQDFEDDKLLIASICSGWGVAFPGIPIFDNMMDLWRKSARNSVSGEIESVCEVHGAICGYPCKSVSGQNCDQKSIRDAKSTSGAGFRSLMKMVDSQPALQWVLFENVARFTQSRGQFGGEQPSQIQAAELKKRGFISFDFVLNALDYGLRQSRSRAWLLYVRQDALKVNFTIQDMTRLMKMWQQDLLPMKAFVHEGICPRETRRKGGQQGATLKWVAAFEEIKKNYGQDRVRKCQQKLTELGLPSILVEREVAVMVLAILQMEDAGYEVWNPPDPPGFFFIQVDQSFDRHLWNRSRGICPCLIPRGKYVVCGPGAWRILTAEEKASMQGVSRADLARYKMSVLSENQLSDLVYGADVYVILGMRVGLLEASEVEEVICWH
ncbi:unnamed protein product [Symbiodinium sp. CCMP2592]|nr:unnamed protein product [Symbiodinium sp. CCMP2592]